MRLPAVTILGTVVITALEVGPEKVDDGKVAGGLTVR
jgi:hypothetical protein